MLLALTAALWSLQTAPPPVQLDTDLVAAAYLDPGARDLVRRARERRAHDERAIQSYRALVKERISLGIRALRRDRMLYRREIAAWVEWRRGDRGRINVLGAREVVPIARASPQVPEDLTSDAPDLAFDPADDRLMFAPDDSSFVRHPLAPGSEAHYRFQSGDTTVISLPDGRTIRLFELRVRARRDEFRLMAGSLWLEGDDYAVVRAVFRPARAFDLELDADPEDKEDVGKIPGFLKPIRAEVRYITMDYGLWGTKWWLPRLVAFDAIADLGSVVRLPMRYERLYSEYEVEGGGAADTLVSAPPADSAVACDSSAADTTGARESGREARRRERRRCREGRFEVRLAVDSAALLTSTHLPPSAFAEGVELISEGEARQLVAELKLLPPAPWQFRAPALRWGFGGAGLVRYNRVEGLSVGARGDFDFGRLTLDAGARVGTAALAPNAELGIGAGKVGPRYRLAGYRRLAAADQWSRALGFGNSLNALVLGRDDGDYYWVLGGELTGAPPATAAQSYAWRLFAERQTAAVRHTDFSFPHVANDDHVFRPNIRADRADQAGATLTLRASRGLNPAGVRWGAEATLVGSTGTFDFAKGSLTGRSNFPLPARLVGGLEAAGGTSTGRVPVQTLWYLGGPATLRGYAGAAASGEAFWRGRVEIASAFPAARLAVFSDAGWAGARGAVRAGRPLVAAGVGASFLDGLLRVDLARALRAPRGWRVELYADGVL